MPYPGSHALRYTKDQERDGAAGLVSSIPRRGVTMHVGGAPHRRQEDYYLSWAGSRVNMKDSASAHPCLVGILSVRT